MNIDELFNLDEFHDKIYMFDFVQDIDDENDRQHNTSNKLIHYFDEINSNLTNLFFILIKFLRINDNCGEIEETEGN